MAFLASNSDGCQVLHQLAAVHSDDDELESIIFCATNDSYHDDYDQLKLERLASHDHNHDNNFYVSFWSLCYYEAYANPPMIGPLREYQIPLVCLQ